MELIGMNNHFSWYVPERVAYISLPTNVDYYYLVQANDALLAWMDDNYGERLIHIITDARNVQEAPTNLMKIRRVSPVFDHERVGWAILVSHNSLHRFFGATVPQMLTGKRSRAFDELDEALAFLKMQATDVDWEQAKSGVLHRV
jgi:hypothetical protein